MGNRVAFILVISLVLVLSISSVLGAEGPAPSAMQQAGNAVSGAKEVVEKAKDGGESWGQWFLRKWGYRGSNNNGYSYYKGPAGAPVGAPIAA